MDKFLARLKNLHKSRMAMLNLGIILATSAIAVIPNLSLKPWHMFLALVGFGVVNLALRFVTTDDLADK